jgi:hypothetical protein
MTMVHVESDTQTSTQEEAKTRFRVASFIQRNGARAQRRAVIAGKATKTVTSTLAKKAVRQVTEPYTALKIGAGAIGVLALGVALWYYTFIVAIMIAMATGSAILCILGAVAFYMIMARIIYMPIMMAYGSYCSSAQDHAMRKVMPQGFQTTMPRGFGFSGI